MADFDADDQPGLSDDPPTGGSGVPAVGNGFSTEERTARLSVLVSEGNDAIKDLGAAKQSFRNHVFWMAFGVSPGALIPALFAISELGGQALVVLVILMVLVESWRAFRARQEVKRLEVVVRDFKDRIAELKEGGETLLEPPEV